MGFTSYKFLILFLPITLVAYVPLLILIADCIVNWNLSHALSKYGKDESGKGKQKNA